MLGAIARAVWLAKTLVDKELKVFAIVAMGAITMALVYCYVDLALSGPRIPLLLGVMLGVVSILHRLDPAAR
jgi:hypothetical protein